MTSYYDLDSGVDSRVESDGLFRAISDDGDTIAVTTTDNAGNGQIVLVTR